MGTEFINLLCFPYLSVVVIVCLIVLLYSYICFNQTRSNQGYVDFPPESLKGSHALIVQGSQLKLLENVTLKLVHSKSFFFIT